MFGTIFIACVMYSIILPNNSIQTTWSIFLSYQSTRFYFSIKESVIIYRWVFDVEHLKLVEHAPRGKVLQQPKEKD